MAQNMAITSLILIIALVIYNRAIIFTFEAPDFRMLAFVTFSLKNGGDVANSYNLFDRFFKSREEAIKETDIKTK